MEDQTLLSLTADIIAAHVGNNSVAAGDLPILIQGVFAALKGVGAAKDESQAEKPKGAVSVRASIKPDHLISMIDGKPYKMLRRHLIINGHTPVSYREAYGLPRDYPMVAATYAAKRSALAKKIGLGRKKAEPEPAPQPEKKAVRKPRTLKLALTSAKEHLAGEG